MSATPIAPADLHARLSGEAPPALLDVREAGEYNTAHIPGASSLPRRLIESRLLRLVPCRDQPIALCDSDGRRATLAAETAVRMGFRQVLALAGGVNRWASEGLPTEWGSNVPSKAFGEAVEVRHGVPSISAQELQRRMAAGEKLVILDTRTPEEYRRACIPGGRSLPGGELARHIADIAREQPNATIVVNCAGRTRSIIGARLLQRMGVPAVDLKNGTSGWVLAGLELERGAARTELPPLSDEGRGAALAFAHRVAAEDGVRMLTPRELHALLDARGDRCLYPIDVRTEEEYRAGHIPGCWWFPGGQAVQRSDDVAAVRDGTLVFACDDGARSAITASWFRQMGFANVCALGGGSEGWQAAGFPLASGPDEPEVFGLAEAAATVRQLAPHALRARLGADPPVTLLFVDSSDAFARGHVPGSAWLPRGWLELRIAEVAPRHDATLVVTDVDGRQAPLAAQTLRELGFRDVAVLHGGIHGWHAAELPLERGLSGVMSAPEDVVPAGPDRTQADMIHYLSWEEALGQAHTTPVA